MPPVFQAVPFFLSGFFYLSAVFMVFSPLPVLSLSFRSGRVWAWAALLTNSVCVGLFSGWFSLALYLGLVGPIAVGLPEFLVRTRSIERAAVLTMATIFLSIGGFFASYGWVKQVNPIQEIRQEISVAVDKIWESAALESKENLGALDPDELKSNVLVELPPAIGIFSLLLIWANVTLLIRMNPLRIRQLTGIEPSIFREWKAPALLVWPTIIALAVMLLDLGPASKVAIGILKFFMAIYAIQGLSVMSYFFDVWRVRGLMRSFGFMAALFLMLPLVLSLGFFDLWFDFRSKVRQS